MQRRPVRRGPAAPKSYQEALDRSRRTGEKMFVFVGFPQSGPYATARDKVADDRRLDLARMDGVKGPALLVIHNGRVDLAENLQPSDLASGRRLVRMEAFRTIRRPGYDARDRMESRPRPRTPSPRVGPPAPPPPRVRPQPARPAWPSVPDPSSGNCSGGS